MQPAPDHLPNIALSIRQPWAWLIVHGWKAVENRTWKTSYRGNLLIHASLTLDIQAWNRIKRDHQDIPLPNKLDLIRGAIIGSVTLADIADNTAYDRSTLWLHTQTYPNDYKMAYATCDGVLYPFNSVQINANKNIDDTTEGFTRWDVTITNSKLTNDMPVMLTAGTSIADIIYPTPTP